VQAKVGVKVNPVLVLSQIWPYALAVLLTFLVTLGCFPAITVRVSTGINSPQSVRVLKLTFFDILRFMCLLVKDRIFAVGGRKKAGNMNNKRALLLPPFPARQREKVFLFFLLQRVQ
jgi:hypothetical protein